MSTHDHSRLEPARFLVENMALLPKGRVLDLAMGHGRNALYLAEQGFDVEGFDRSADAVEHALERSREAGLLLRAQVADLEANYHIAEAAYDVIICFNYLHRPLISPLKEGLRRNGMVVYETFIVEQVRFGRPKNPDYLLKENELLHMFRDFRCLRYHEGIVEARKAVAGIVAQKV